MRIGQIVPHIDKEASGPSYSVPALAKSLGILGEVVTLITLAAGDRTFGEFKLRLFEGSRALRRFGFSWSFSWFLMTRYASFDVLHTHGLWSWPNLFFALLPRKSSACFVISTRGCLSKWSINRKRWLKIILWPMQLRSINRCAFVHATSYKEYEEIRSLGINIPVAVIPNGVDLIEKSSDQSARSIPSLVPEINRSVLFLSRLHPKKGLENLIEAWSLVESRYPSCRMVIAGSGSKNYENELRLLVSKLGVRTVDFVGPLYGEEKVMAFRSADVFILPSYSENFGMVVAESLATGTPVITSTQTPWEDLLTFECGWQIPNDVDSIVSTLIRVLDMPSSTLKEMGRNGIKLVSENYAWIPIAERMVATYKWAIGGGSCPSWVYLD